jgi:hypothetical protein
VRIMKNLIRLNALHFSTASSFSGPNVISDTLFIDPCHVRFFLNIRDQILHPYRTGEISVVHFHMHCFGNRWCGTEHVRNNVFQNLLFS